VRRAKPLDDFYVKDRATGPVLLVQVDYLRRRIGVVLPIERPLKNPDRMAPLALPGCRRRSNHDDAADLAERQKRRYCRAGGHWTAAEWEALKAESTVAVDHIVPVSMGGSNSIDNIQPLASRATASKHG
jgi:hypothetical protein